MVLKKTFCNFFFNRKKWEALTWKRPKEIYKGKTYFVIKDGVDPSDINQGDLGDCYFLSCISCLAAYPKRIKRIFNNTEVQQSGCYCIALCIQGCWEEIIIDDSFPCKRNTPYFTSSKENEIWVMLLEKAWAKVNFFTKFRQMEDITI